MRIIIQHGDRDLVNLGIMVRHGTAEASPAKVTDAAGPDAHGTVAAHIEQADEPAPGFGFGSVKTVVSRGPG